MRLEQWERLSGPPRAFCLLAIFLKWMEIFIGRLALCSYPQFLITSYCLGSGSSKQTQDRDLVTTGIFGRGPRRGWGDRQAGERCHERVCYGMDCVPSKFIWWSPNPSTSESICHWQKGFQEVMKVKWGHMGGPWSSMTGILIRRVHLDIENHVKM